MRRVVILGLLVAGTSLAATAFGGPGVERRPFEGEAVVRIRNLPDHKLVAEVPVTKSRFEAKLAPGDYRLRAVPYPHQPGPTCWESKSRRISVETAQDTRVRLRVYNACVV